MEILNFKELVCYEAVLESLNDVYKKMDYTDRAHVDKLTNLHDDLLSQYNLSPREISNIKLKLDDTIRVKYRDNNGK